MLFGGGALIRCWGRIGTKGRTLGACYKERAEVHAPVEAIVKQRFRRGYEVVDVR
jgi:predicted DNA-binding WGR domain protein